MPDPFAEICYQTNFLKEVIARVDFLSPLPGVEASLPPQLSELAVSTFPIPEPHDTLPVGISPDGGVKSTGQPSKEWLFHGKERTKTLTINRQAVLVHHKKYQTYELLKDEFVKGS